MIINDENGKWKIDGNIKILIEPSNEYISKRNKEKEIITPKSSKEIAREQYQLATTQAKKIEIIAKLLDLE